MCGFGGLFNNSFPLFRQQVCGIAESVSFRGPDSQGIRVFDHSLQPSEKGNNVLFFNRLAILDLDQRSDQPFEDGRYTLMFNGEIYNYQDLKAGLLKEGQEFHTTSDTEVLFRALQRLGHEAIGKLNGMFAFCWIDRQEKRFIIARDRMGIKPLYYRITGNSLAFASEMESVMRLSPDIPPIDPESVHHFLWTQFIPTPQTILKGVYKLPPGHFLKGSWEDLSESRPIHPVPYWDAYSQASAKLPSSNPANLESILVDSLSHQLVADVPLGLFLSSGVDSSLLAAVVNKHFAASQQFNFFTVAFTEATASDESRDAIRYIQGFNNPSLVSHTLTVDSSLLGKYLDNLYEYFDEPFGDQTSLLNWVISQKAKEFVTVVLSGDGADELFWGYPRYAQWKNPSLALPYGIRLRGISARLCSAVLPGSYRNNKAGLELEPDLLHRHFTLFLPPVLKELARKPIWEDRLWALQGACDLKDNEDAVAWWDLKTYLADAMLYKVDRASMAASLEVRVPYLDNEVIDFALSLPLHEKSNEDYAYKSILKKLLSRLAPHYDIRRPKKGFNFPLDKWLRVEWKDRVLSLVNKDMLGDMGLDDQVYMPMIDQYYNGDRRYCIPVWYLLNLALWNRQFKPIEPLH
jgi:asparagine synthase (glutamine-hydrolysing)